MKIESLTPSFIQLAEFTVIEVKGSDAGAFLHRLSTNHILNLDVGSNCLSAFLDQKGRLIAVAYVLRSRADIFRLIIPYAQKHRLIEWLDQFLFAEDASLRDVTADFSLAIAIGLEQPGFCGPEFRFRHSSQSSHFIFLPQGSITLVDCRQLQMSEYEALRIAGQVPFSAQEINTNFNPLQLGLGEVIHWAKGCYIGQEVISRLESKEKAAKTLLGGRVAALDLPVVRPGEAVHSDGGPAGILTSVSPIDLPGESNILLVLKRAQAFTNGHTDLSKVRIDITTQDE